MNTAVANVLDIFAENDPGKIIQKIKLHLLTHGPDDFLRFGPLLGACTEAFESFNAIFRNCSVFSNHLAPSRDIAVQLARQEDAGWGVRDYLSTQPMLQGLIGWTPTEMKFPGEKPVLYIDTFHNASAKHPPQSALTFVPLTQILYT